HQAHRRRAITHGVWRPWRHHPWRRWRPTRSHRRRRTHWWGRRHCRGRSTHATSRCACQINPIHLGKACCSVVLLLNNAKHFLFLAWLQIREVQSLGDSEFRVCPLLIIPSSFIWRRCSRIGLVCRIGFVRRQFLITSIKRYVSWRRLRWRPLGLANTNHHCEPAFFLLCHFSSSS